MKHLTTLVVLTVLGLAACGGSSAPTAETTTTTAAPVTSLPAESTTTTAAPATTTTTKAPEPPMLTVEPSGDSVETYVTVIEGTTDPGTLVTVDTEPVVTTNEGTFAVQVFNTPGENQHTVAATGDDGLATTSILSYEWTPQPGWAAAVGDSVMLGSKAEIEKRLGEDIVDATVSRQFLDAPKLVRDLLARPVPPELIVIGLGTNGPVNARHFDEVMELAADVPLVAFVNVRVPRSWESTSNTQLAEGVERYENAVLVDWWTPTHDMDELFAADGFHPKQAGRVIMGELIASTVFPNWVPLEEG
ncbi:MAG: hypothetical protein ACR2N2_02350 [Acidimicrobiia bacterium]